LTNDKEIQKISNSFENQEKVDWSIEFSTIEWDFVKTLSLDNLNDSNLYSNLSISYFCIKSDKNLEDTNNQVGVIAVFNHSGNNIINTSNNTENENLIIVKKEVEDNNLIYQVLRYYTQENKLIINDDKVYLTRKEYPFVDRWDVVNFTTESKEYNLQTGEEEEVLLYLQNYIQLQNIQIPEDRFNCKGIDCLGN